MANEFMNKVGDTVTYDGKQWNVRDANWKTGKLIIRHYFSDEKGDHVTIVIKQSKIKAGP